MRVRDCAHITYDKFGVDDPIIVRSWIYIQSHRWDARFKNQPWDWKCRASGPVCWEHAACCWRIAAVSEPSGMLGWRAGSSMNAPPPRRGTPAIQSASPPAAGAQEPGIPAPAHPHTFPGQGCFDIASSNYFVFEHQCTIDPVDPKFPTKAMVKTRWREEKPYKAADKVKILQGERVRGGNPTRPDRHNSEVTDHHQALLESQKFYTSRNICLTYCLVVRSILSEIGRPVFIHAMIKCCNLYNWPALQNCVEIIFTAVYCGSRGVFLRSVTLSDQQQR